MANVVGKIMVRSGIKGYNVLKTGDKKITEDDADETKVEGFSEPNLINNTALQ